MFFMILVDQLQHTYLFLKEYNIILMLNEPFQNYFETAHFFILVKSLPQRLR